jgi:hypothetical protein
MNGLFLKPFRLPFSNQETANRNAAMDDHEERGLARLQAILQSVDDRTQQGQAVAALIEIVGELAFWAIQPKVGNPIFWLFPTEKKDALQERLWALDSRIRSVFDATGRAFAVLLEIVRDARACCHKDVATIDDWVDSGGLERLKHGEQWLLRLRQELERDAREKRGFTRWASEVLADLPLMNPRTLNPRQVANLRQWVGLFVQHSGRPDDDLSTAELNAVMELSRSLQPFVVRAAQAIGFGDWGRLFAEDYQSRSDAWEEFAAAVENPVRPAEVQTADSSPVAIAAPQDRSAAFTAAGRRQPVVEWSNPRSPQQWRLLLKNAGQPHSERGWPVRRRKAGNAITGEPKNCRITRELAAEWGLRLPEFEGD